MNRPEILFVTKRTCPQVTLTTITPATARQVVNLLYGPDKPLYHDIETNGKDPYLSELLLDAWYDGDVRHPVLVLDSYTVSTEEVFGTNDFGNRLIVAHNADFEKRWAIKRGLKNGRFMCTMVNAQTIMSGVTNLKYDIISEMERRRIPIHPTMDKRIRNEFNGVDPATFEIQDKHILYNASDVIDLPTLLERQYVHINNMDLNWLITLRSWLVSALAEAEMTGFVHDANLWLNLLHRRTIQAEELKNNLNKYLLDRDFNLLDFNKPLREKYEGREKKIAKLQARFVKLTDQVVAYEQKGKTNLKAYQVCCESIAKVGREMSDAQAPMPPPTVNWGSPEQPLQVMVALGINPLPMAQDKKSYQMKAGVGKEARTNWFTDNETHPHMDFMKMFDKFKKIEHNIKSFGQDWIDKYTNPVTGKVHTIFRQAGTRTGRFASGNADDGYFNLQQIPKEATKMPDGKEIAEYRACFRTDPGRKIATLDYTGCEIVCMISLSGDLSLKKISELADQHSYLGTKCWRAVYNDRYNKTNDPQWKELAETYTMTKGKARDKFKNSGAFPVVYGVKPGKVSAIQGIPKHEAQIFIDTIEGEMPKVINFVKSNAAFALKHGYVIHNKRTNSRRWFKNVIDANEVGGTLSNKEAGKVETAARNSPIQGTNVDIIIEAIVTIYRWAKLYKVPIRLLGQVHDELIYDFPEDMDWIPEKLKTLMSRVAQRYLIPEIHMHADCAVGYYWIK